MRVSARRLTPPRFVISALLQLSHCCALSLLGLRPFQNELMSLISRPEIDQCRTLLALTKLIALRQRARSKSVFSHLIDLRDAFSDMDPTFRDTEMQDASEFLLRLLDTMKEEIDACRPANNPVRKNFQYQTVESYYGFQTP